MSVCLAECIKELAEATLRAAKKDNKGVRLCLKNAEGWLRAAKNEFTELP